MIDHLWVVVLIGTLTILVAGAVAPGTIRLGPPPEGVADAAPCGDLQARIDAVPSGTVLDLGGCAYVSTATVDRPMTLRGGSIRVAAGQPGLTITSGEVTVDGVRIEGANGTAFAVGESGIVAIGTARAPLRDIRIVDCEIDSFGYAGVYARNVAGMAISGNQVHDIVYAGILVLSGIGGLVEENVVRRIGVTGSAANAGNAYGIGLTRFDGDLVSDPPTSDVLVERNRVEDVPTWHALDTHAGRRISFVDNVVERSPRAIFITTDGQGNRPMDIEIRGNLFGDPSPVVRNLTAVTTYRADGVTIAGNTAIGWPRGGFYTDFEGQSVDVVMSDNRIVP